MSASVDLNKDGNANTAASVTSTAKAASVEALTSASFLRLISMTAAHTSAKGNSAGHRSQAIS